MFLLGGTRCSELSPHQTRAVKIHLEFHPFHRLSLTSFSAVIAGPCAKQAADIALSLIIQWQRARGLLNSFFKGIPALAAVFWLTYLFSPNSRQTSMRACIRARQHINKTGLNEAGKDKISDTLRESITGSVSWVIFLSFFFLFAQELHVPHYLCLTDCLDFWRIFQPAAGVCAATWQRWEGHWAPWAFLVSCFFHVTFSRYIVNLSGYSFPVILENLH